MLLDVGCANGDFPRYMRERGWQVEGVEIGHNAREITDFPVYRCELPDIPIHTPRYDAITAWAVLEHVHDPMAYFRKAGHLLQPGGRFVFLVTDFESLPSRRLFREDVPRHLYFFSEATVRAYLEAAGLRLLRADRHNRIFEMRPVNWLRHYLFNALLGRELRWQDLPETPGEYYRRVGGAGLGAKMGYALMHPFAILDRILMPVFEVLASPKLTCGIVTYVATKADN